MAATDLRLLLCAGMGAGESPSLAAAFLFVVVLVGAASLDAGLGSEDLLWLAVVVISTGNVELGTELFTCGSNGSLDLAALEVFVAILLLLLPLLAAPLVLLLVITGALCTDFTWADGITTEVSKCEKSLQLLLTLVCVYYFWSIKVGNLLDYAFK